MMVLVLLKTLRSIFSVQHHPQNNGGTEDGIIGRLSHFYYFGISNSWRAAPALYLEQMIPSDCINCSEIRLNESPQR